MFQALPAAHGGHNGRSMVTQLRDPSTFSCFHSWPLPRAAPRTAPPQVPAIPVAVGMVEQRSIPFELNAVGTVEPFQAVTVQPQVTGQLMRVAFQEGDEVEKGQVLFQIDPRQFNAAAGPGRSNPGPGPGPVDQCQPGAGAVQDAFRGAEHHPAAVRAGPGHGCRRRRPRWPPREASVEQAGSICSMPPSGPRSVVGPGACWSGRETWSGPM